VHDQPTTRVETTTSSEAEPEGSSTEAPPLEAPPPEGPPSALPASPSPPMPGAPAADVARAAPESPTADVAPAAPESPTADVAPAAPEAAPSQGAPPNEGTRPLRPRGRDAPPRLGDVLVAAGVLTPTQLSEALHIQQREGRRRRLGEILVHSGVITEDQVTRALSGQLRLSYVDLPSLAIPSEIINLVPRSVADRHFALPVGLTDEGEIIVAMSDPTDVVAKDDIRLVTGRRVKPACARPSQLTQAINRYYRYVDDGPRDPFGGTRPSPEFLAAVTSPRIEESAPPAPVGHAPAPTSDLLESVTKDLPPAFSKPALPAPPIRTRQGPTEATDLVDVIFEDAAVAGASDIHIEPGEEGVDVRFRIDGLLQEVLTVPKHLQSSLTSRVKILAQLDIAERRRPQDGRISIKLRNDKAVDARVSSMPTLHGEKVVIRLLDASKSILTFDRLGLSKEDREIVTQAIARPHGMVLAAGPTGSGKSSTLYALLREVHRPNINIVTIEDPVEYQLRGVNQVQVDEKTGVTFAAALRTVLRQDPDVVMVGEIRDAETAEIAFQASLTGHLVLSTIHTSDAPSTITRLVDMGIEPALIASSLSLVIAQRLVRRVCSECAKPAEVSARVLEALRILPVQGTLVRGEGCSSCHYTGYQGRIGIYQVLDVDDIVREQIVTQVSERTISHAAQMNGTCTLQQAGVELALRGVTTAEEVVRVAYSVERPRLSCPGCGAEAQPEFVVCPFCDTDIARNVCQNCRKEIMPGWMTCPYCKTAIGHEDSEEGGAKRVLVVDDDEDLGQVLESMLASEGYAVMRASSGEEALRLAARHRPHLVVLDMILPDKSGIEVCRELRRLPQTSLVPVMFLTGKTDADTEVAVFDAGADDYVAKPVDHDRLVARVHGRLRSGALTK
jgi:type IV pilus assembly protein PilB